MIVVHRGHTVDIITYLIADQLSLPSCIVIYQTKYYAGTATNPKTCYVSLNREALYVLYQNTFYAIKGTSIGKRLTGISLNFFQ